MPWRTVSPDRRRASVVLRTRLSVAFLEPFRSFPLSRSARLLYDARTVMAAPSTNRPRVLLADDQVANLELLRMLLETEFEVVAAVGDGQALIDAATRLSPDVIVTDIAMPIVDGIAAVQEILRRNASARVVFVTVHADPAIVRRGLAIGGLGYVLKVSAGEQLVPAVWAAFRGERWCLCKS
jgi:CheY-like chemotaxis protein